MTPPALVCPHCGLGVRAGPPETVERLASDPGLQATLYYECPDHGVVDPVYPAPPAAA